MDCLQEERYHSNQTYNSNNQQFKHPYLLESNAFHSAFAAGLPTNVHANLISTFQAMLSICPNEIIAAGTVLLGISLITGVLCP